MFGNLKNLGNLMKMASEAKEKAAELQRELEQKRVEGEAGGGAVRVLLNGKGRVQRVDIDQPLMMGIAGDDKTVVEELIAAAFNDGMEKVQALITEQVKEMTGGMDIPGLSGLLGQ